MVGEEMPHAGTAMVKVAFRTKNNIGSAAHYAPEGNKALYADARRVVGSPRCRQPLSHGGGIEEELDSWASSKNSTPGGANLPNN